MNNSVISFPAGTVIVKQSEPGEKMYIIESGTVEISLETKNGDTVPITKLGEGEFFGEMSFFDEKTRSATVTAVSDVDVKVIDKNDMPYTLEKTPLWFQELFKKLMERIRYANMAVIHQVETQNELFEKERLRAVIEVAGAAAHEINQPLSIMLSSCEILKNHQISDELQSYLNRIIEASLRISKIVTQMQVIQKYVTKPYVENNSILDLEKSSENTE